MMKYLALLILALAAGGAVAVTQLGWGPWSKGAGAAAAVEAPVAAAPAIPVTAAAARYVDFPKTDDVVGTIQSLNSVLVRSQVDGRLEAVNVEEGKDVKKSDLLATIDPTTYTAQLNQAIAKQTQDMATLANAEQDLARFVTLVERNAGTQQQADTQRSLVAQLTALVNADKAAIANAAAVLEYTKIRSPIDGRAGMRQVDVGNIVRAGEAAGIVSIVQLRPIAVAFSLPQSQVMSIRRAIANGPVKVQALDPDSNLISEGRIDVIDNQFDVATGTLKIRAILPNDDSSLLPGQFVKVRVFAEVLRNATAVPVEAVQQGVDGAYVYLLGEDERVHRRKVAVALQDQSLAAIGSGLAPPQRVVTAGFAQLTEGARVKAIVSGGSGERPPQSQNSQGPEAALTTLR
jgi:multidrug efflux system membrane fusion protein